MVLYEASKLELGRENSEWQVRFLAHGAEHGVCLCVLESVRKWRRSPRRIHHVSYLSGFVKSEMGASRCRTNLLRSRLGVRRGAESCGRCFEDGCCVGCEAYASNQFVWVHEMRRQELHVELPTAAMPPFRDGTPTTLGQRALRTDCCTATRPMQLL